MLGKWYAQRGNSLGSLRCWQSKPQMDSKSPSVSSGLMGDEPVQKLAILHVREKGIDVSVIDFRLPACPVAKI
jgi:hypothetical protein